MVFAPIVATGIVHYFTPIVIRRIWAYKIASINKQLGTAAFVHKAALASFWRMT